MLVRTLDEKLLLGSLLVVATCALTYELLIGTVASYFMGSSVLHFSLTTGAFLFFTGIGSYLSRLVKTNLIETFISLEIILGIVGGVSGLVLFFIFANTDYFYPVALLFLCVTGVIAGLEIPLLARILSEKGALKDVLSSVFAIDYLGAVVASVMFPLVLLPSLGAMRVALLTGALNLTVALVVITFLKTQVYKRVYKVILSFLGLIGLCSIFIFSDPIKAIIEKSLFQDQVLLSTQSEYQQIILTGHRDDLRLYLNGDLQFSSVDEYRYHETLVHIPLGLSPNPRNVLLLGAGDGLAVREILKHSSVESITLVDLDPKIVELSSQYPLLRQLNNESLASNKLKIVNHDAFSYMLSNTKLYDVVIVDLPDPNDENLGRLYTQEFYQLINRSLTPAGVMITQAGSPYFTKDAFWSIQVTLQEVFKNTLPIQVEVPSFGLWGFQLASEVPLDITKIKLPKDLKYLTSDIIPVLSIFGADVSKDTSTTQVSTLDNLHVIKAYRQGREEFE